MSAQTLSDMAYATQLRVQLDRLEVVNVGGGEEHVADDRGPLVDFEGVACEKNLFGYDRGWVGREERARSCEDELGGI